VAQINLKEFLGRLQKNRNILKEREAKYATAAPLNLLNQIEDYEQAIALTKQAIEQDVSLDDLQAEFTGLNLEVNAVVFLAQEPPRKNFTGHNPYRGLQKFTEEDHEFFFGRTSAIEELLDMVKYSVDTETSRELSNLVAVLGPSGSGKSSLVRAGLVPALRQGRLSGSEQWPIKTMVPGLHPLTALAAQFVEPTGRGLPPLRADLDTSEQALHQLMLESLTLAEKPEEAVFVLVVDQFEELFTLCEDEAERQAFLAHLLHVAQVRHNRGFIILAMRADFYAKAAQYKNLAETITINQMLVSPMTERELREAILLPAEAVGLELEKALVESLLKDTAKAPGVLPLLQHTLLELFERRDGNLLTLAAYQEIGGVQGSLAHRADAIMNDLTADQQQMARRVFMRLVQPGEGTLDTRRQATFEEVLSQASEIEAVEEVVQILADANLLITGRDPETEVMVLDVPHEALIQEWPLLRNWLEEDRQGFRLRQQLSQTAWEWDSRNRDESILYRGGRLLDIEAWVAVNPGEINPLEAAFLEASVAARERARRRTRMIIAGLAIGFAVAVVGAIFGFVQRNQAITAQREADVERNKAEMEATAALIARGTAVANEQRAEVERQAAENERQIAVAAQATADARLLDVERENRLALARQLAAQARVDIELRSQRSALLAIEAILVTKENDGFHLPAAEEALRQVLSTISGLPLVGHTGTVEALAVSPDSRWLYSGSNDGTVRRWDLTDLELPSTLLADKSYSALDFGMSQDGTWLATADDFGNTVRLWNTHNLELRSQILTAHTGAVKAVAISPDGQWLASGGHDHNVRLWSINASMSSEVSDFLFEIDSSVRDLVFGPNNRWLAAAEGWPANTVWLWDLSAPDPGAKPVVLRGHESDPVILAFSADGKWLASGAQDFDVRLWDMEAEDPAEGVTVLRGHGFSVVDVAFSPDGRWLATAGSTDNTARLWDLSTVDGEPMSIVLRGHSRSVDLVAFSPDSTRLATASDDTTVRLWDITAAEPEVSPVVLSGFDAGVTSLTFTPDGKWLAAGSADNTVRLWDMTLPDLTLEPRTLSQDGGWIELVMFSSDGRWLAAGVRGDILLWKVGDSETLSAPVVLTDDTTIGWDIAFSADNRWLATGSWTTSSPLWDLANAALRPARTELAEQVDIVSSVSFSPDSRWLATGNRGMVRLWDLADPQAGPKVLSGHPDRIDALAFSPDGRWLISGSWEDTNARLWDTSDFDAPPILLPGHNPDVLYAIFSPDSRWLSLAGQSNLIRVWNVENTEQLSSPVVLDGMSHVLAMDASPNSRWLASGHKDANVRLWDLHRLPAAVQPITLTGHERFILDVAFSADSRRLASGSRDNLIKVWDVENPDIQPITLRGHTAEVNAVSFDPSGRWLASGGQDGTTRIWRLRIDDLIDLACRTVGRNLTPSEWQEFLPNRPYRKTCP
jgi:WD40 repeat protein